MDVVVKDTDVLHVIAEYLHSRKLILSCNSLINESKIIQDTNKEKRNLNLEALQTYCWAGKWNSVHKFLQPFCLTLDNFPTKKLKLLLFRQCYCESQSVCFQKNTDQPNFDLIRSEALAALSETELKELIQSVHEYYDNKIEIYKYPQAVLISTRMETYNEILELTKEVFYQNISFDDSGKERLISMMLKASFYEMCTSYCSDRAVDNTKNYTKVSMEKEADQVVEVKLKNTIDQTSIDDVSPSFYYWLRGIQNSEVFKQPFIEEDVQIIVEKMNLVDDEEKSDELKKEILSEHLSSSKQQSVIDSQEVTHRSIKANESENEPINNDQTVYNEEPIQPIKESQHTITDETIVSENNFNMESKQRSHNFNSSIEDITNNNNNNSLAASLQGPLTSTKKIPDVSGEIIITNMDSLNNNNGDTPRNGKPSNEHVRDSYADFLAQKNLAQQNRDQVLQILQQKENETEKLRKILEHKLEVTSNRSTNSLKSSQIINKSISIEKKPENKLTTPRSENKLHKMKSPKKTHSYNYIPVEKTGDTAAIRAVSFHPGGNIYAVGTNSQALKMCKVPANLLASAHRLDYNAKMGLKWSQPFINIPKVHKGSIYACTWSENGDVIATCSNDKSVKLFLFDEENEKLTAPPGDLTHHKGIVRDVTFMPTQSSPLYLCSAGPSDGNIFVTNCETYAPVHKISAHKDQILSLFSWQPQMLASASQDGSVKMWDLRTTKCAHEINLPVKAPTSVCVDSTGGLLAVGRTDCITQVYDLNNYNMPLHTFKQHESEVRSVRFHPFKNILLSASYDNTSVVTEFDTQDSTHCTLRHHHDKLIQGRWHPSGLMLATTSADQTCVLSVVQHK